MVLDAAFNNFIFAKQLQGCSEKTLNCYRQVIYPLVSFVGSDVFLEELTREKYNEYISVLVSRKYSRTTLASYVRQIKVFLRWLESEYDLDLSTDKLRVPKAYKKVVHIYSDDELQLIFDTIHAESDWITARNRALVALMLDSGLRQNEVCTLRSEDISWQNSTLKVVGKGSKERVVPFGNLSRKFMLRYRQLCPYWEFLSLEYFFVGRRGEILSADSVKHFVYRLSSKLPFEFSSHRLRHNFATNYCLDQYKEHGQVDLYRLMILMGHEDIMATQIYLSVTKNRIKDVYDKTHPRA